MFRGARSPAWTVAPEGGAVHLWLDHPPSVLECYEIVDRVRASVGADTVVVLEGPGWSTPRTWKLARLVREVVSAVGARVRVESAALRWTVIEGVGAVPETASGIVGTGAAPEDGVRDPRAARSA